MPDDNKPWQIGKGRNRITGKWELGIQIGNFHTEEEADEARSRLEKMFSDDRNWRMILGS